MTFQEFCNLSEAEKAELKILSLSNLLSTDLENLFKNHLPLCVGLEELDLNNSRFEGLDALHSSDLSASSRNSWEPLEKALLSLKNLKNLRLNNNSLPLVSSLFWMHLGNGLVGRELDLLSLADNSLNSRQFKAKWRCVGDVLKQGNVICLNIRNNGLESWPDTSWESVYEMLRADHLLRGFECNDLGEVQQNKIAEILTGKVPLINKSSLLSADMLGKTNGDEINVDIARAASEKAKQEVPTTSLFSASYKENEAGKKKRSKEAVSPEGKNKSDEMRFATSVKPLEKKRKSQSIRDMVLGARADVAQHEAAEEAKKQSAEEVRKQIAIDAMQFLERQREKAVGSHNNVAAPPTSRRSGQAPRRGGARVFNPISLESAESAGDAEKHEVDKQLLELKISDKPSNGASAENAEKETLSSKTSSANSTETTEFSEIDFELDDSGSSSQNKA